MSRKPGSVQTRTFRASEVIFCEGDVPRDEAFLVHAGRVDVKKKVGEEERLAPLRHRGGREPVTLVVIPAKRLDYLVRTNPALAMAIIRDLSAKLRATNQLLAAEGERRAGPPGPLTS